MVEETRTKTTPKQSQKSQQLHTTQNALFLGVSPFTKVQDKRYIREKMDGSNTTENLASQFHFSDSILNKVIAYSTGYQRQFFRMGWS